MSDLLSARVREAAPRRYISEDTVNYWADLISELERELAEARASLEQVDNVLLVSGIAAKGDYRQAIHDLITQSIREQNDPALTRVIAEVALDAAQAQCARAVEALKPFAGFWRAFQDKPIRGLDPEEIYSIHGGRYVSGGTSLLWNDMENAQDVLADPSTAAEWLREKLREAWEQGYELGYTCGCADDGREAANPYAAGAPGEVKS